MKDRIKSIDSIRFILCIFILYYHILHSNIIKYTGGSPVYLKLQDLSTYTGTIVECFFIISGFFLYKTMIYKKNLGILQYIADRFVRLWPALFFTIAVGVVFFNQGFYSAIIQSFMLHATGVSLEWGGINWYTPPLFWGGIFLFALIKVMDGKKANLLVAVLVYFFYVIDINYTNGGIGRKTIYTFLSLSMLRAVAGVGLGYLFAIIMDRIPDIKKGYISCIIFTLAEISSIIVLMHVWFCKPAAYKNIILVILMFLVLFACLCLNRGIISKLLDNRLLSWGGKYTYSIYVMQQITFWILQRTFWKNTAFLQHNVCATMAISIVVCIIIGIIVYYLVERPAIRFYKRNIQNR